jgi:dTDP-glucose 4,6-dehydratase
VNIIISGVAGFLGSHLCDRFINDGHKVTGIDNFRTGNKSNISHLFRNPLFSLIEQDVADFIFIPQHLDAVLHFASPASPNPISPYGYPNLPIQTMKAGALGTHNMLGLAKANEARFLLASTSEIYGDPQEHPQNEKYWGHVDPIGPRAVYDEAKRFAEALTMAYHRFHNVNTCIARIFNTYGPRMRIDDGRVVPNFINQSLKHEPLTIYGDGEQTRSFCFVDDLVEGINKLLFSKEHEPINLGNPKEISINRFAGLINKITKNSAGVIYKEGMFFGHDPQRRSPDISRAKLILNWQPKISLEDGLNKTVEYFKSIFIQAYND